MSQYIVQGIFFAVAGIIALLAAILDWNGSLLPETPSLSYKM